MDFSATLAEIEKLTVEDRLRLVDAIWVGIVAEEETFRLSEAQRRDLDRRVASYEAEPDNVLDWEDVYESLRNEP